MESRAHKPFCCKGGGLEVLMASGFEILESRFGRFQAQDLGP